MKRNSEWPRLIKSGNVSIPIYKSFDRKGDRTYDQFKVVYYQHADGQRSRRFKTFSALADAERFAQGVNASIVKGDSNSLTLTGEECHAYREAMAVLKKSGMPLIQAVSDYAAAVNKLGDVPLSLAVAGYLKAYAEMRSLPVQAVVDEMIEAKRTNKKKTSSEVYLKDLRGRLDRFAAAFQMNIHEVTPSQIGDWLGSLVNLSGRTQHNYGRLVRTLFNFAEKRKYLPKDGNPFDGDRIDISFRDDEAIEIFTPEELRKLLSFARPELIPFVAIGAFSGLRHEEIKRLDWSDVKAEAIAVDAGKAKTRRRRTVPISPNLAEWLAPHRKLSGPIVPFVHISKQIGWLADSAQVKWKHNALRHSFISYRMASIKNAAKTALEAGNSEVMIFRHYNELVTDAAAAEWFSIFPPPCTGSIAPSSGGEQ